MLCTTMLIGLGCMALRSRRRVPILAAPVMMVLMILVRDPDVMGRFVVRGWLYGLGWASTAGMALCIVGMGVAYFIQ